MFHVYVTLLVAVGGIMTSLREMKEREYIPKKTFVKLVVAGAFSLSKILITNMGDLKKVNKSSVSTKRYVRPPRRYELPVYHEKMQAYESDEKYLRQTRYCNCHSPEIIALANHLGAFKKSDYEFAESAFAFAKRNLDLEIMVLDDVEPTLHRGTGTCLQINSVFVALCRAAGIKARYRLFSVIQSQAMYEEVYDPLMKRWYDALGYFSIEADIEVFIEGKWVTANAGPTPDRQAAMKSPITKLGESAVGMWFDEIPGTSMLSESLPYGIGLLSQALIRIAPGTVDNINANIQDQISKGKKIIAAAGGEVAYDRQARQQKDKFKMPTIELEKKNLIIEE